MFCRPAWVAVCLVLCVVVSAEASKVEALYDKTFEEVATEGPLLFVKFQAPWCGYCNKFEPTWELVDQNVKARDVPIKIANVDCTDPGTKKTCKKYNVTGYPDMRLIYPVGDDLFAAKYDGGRDYRALMSFIDTASANPKDLGGEVMSFVEKRPYKAAPAEAMKEDVVAPNAKGEVLNIDLQALQAAAKQGPLFVKFFAPWCGHCKKLAPTWEKLAGKAAQHGSSVKIAEGDCTSTAKDACGQYKVTGYPKLMLFFADGDSIAAASYSGGRTLNDMWAWMRKVEADPATYRDKTQSGKADKKKDIRRGPGSKQGGGDDPGEPGAVTKITDKSQLEAMVKEGPVFAKFYAPWCGHCKKLAPTWEKLAGKATKEGNAAKVTEVDCTEEGGKAICSQFGVTGFPKMKMLFQDGEQVVSASYNGERALDKMYDFMAKAEKSPMDYKDKPGKQAAAPPAASPSAPKADSKVKVIESSNGLHEMLQKGPVFVKFFAPWCGHCKKLAPTWEKMAELAEKDGLKNQVAELDCTTNAGKPMCAQFGVSGFPKMKMLFADGDSVGHVEFAGSRTMDQMFSFLKNTDKPDPTKDKVKLQLRKVAPPPSSGPSNVKAIESASGLQGLLEKGPLFVKFFAPWCGHCKAMAPTWVQLADLAAQEGKTTQVGELDCTTEAGKPLCGQFGVKGFPKMKMLFADGDKVGVVSYEGLRGLDNMYDFLEKTVKPDPEKEASVKLKAAPAAPLPPPTGPSRVVSIEDTAALTSLLQTAPIMIKFFAPWCGHCKKMAPTWVHLADQTDKAGTKITIAEVDCTTNGGKPLCSKFGVNGFPKIKYVFSDGAGGAGVVSFSGPRSLEGFAEFMTKTSADPNAVKEETVQLVVAKFDETNSKALQLDGKLVETAREGDVFVKFYSPSCGHCKKLAPTWSALAGEAEAKKLGVKVVKVDCTAEASKPECKLFGVKAFPTLKYLFRDGDNVGVVKYDKKDRSLKGLQSFLDEASSDPHGHTGREEDVLKSGVRSKKKYVHVTGAGGTPKYSYAVEPLDDDGSAKDAKAEL